MWEWVCVSLPTFFAASVWYCYPVWRDVVTDPCGGWRKIIWDCWGR